MSCLLQLQVWLDLLLMNFTTGTPSPDPNKIRLASLASNHLVELSSHHCLCPSYKYAEKHFAQAPVRMHIYSEVTTLQLQLQ